MSDVTTITGAVSAARVSSREAVTTTYTPASHSSSVESVKHELMNFRIDNRPVYIHLEINVTNGDLVTAGGIQKGEFEALVVNNHTTRTMYSVPKPSTVPEIIYIVIGILTLGFHGLGIILMIGGFMFMLNKNKKIKQIRDAWDMAGKAQAPAAK